jgi:PTH1 family peptidyl-tRNA hydrolase
MFLIVGLGNPGEEYSKTRHNAGFIILDALFGSEVWEKDSYAQALVWKGEISGKDGICAKPTTFMNNSGDSVKYLLEQKEIPLSQLAVIYDDIDLPLGSLRISHDRGDGGHNGIKSIVSLVGSTEFARIRLGVAPVDEEGNIRKPDDTADYVLKNFSGNELEKLLSQKERIAQAISLILIDGVEKAMNVVNGNL